MSNLKVLVSIVFLTSIVFAQSNEVSFPKNFDKGVLYFKKDRGSITEDIYTSKEVIKAVQNNKPIPSGTVITLVEYFAKNEMGSDGFALRGDLKRYVVMEKRTGWNKNLPNSQKSGEWKYQVFNPDKTINHDESLGRCVSCHSSEVRNDFVYTYNEMKNFNLE